MKPQRNTEEQRFINLEALEKADVQQDPFPFLVVFDFLREESTEQIFREFPKIDFPGSIPLNQLQLGPAFEDFIKELEGDALRSVIEKKLNVNLQNRPTIVTLRGRTRSKDGRIHTDTKSKIVTLLLYLNREWNTDEGRLRILRNGKNLEDYVLEISPTLGTCLIFKVTDNCWHGHKPFEGERRALQLNYLVNDAAWKQHVSRHSITAKLKSFRRWIRGDEY